MWNSYVNWVRKIVAFFERREWPKIAIAFGVLLIEPWETVKAAFLTPLNLKKHFHFYGLNPSKITAGKRAILFIHGNFHDQTAALSFARYLQPHALFAMFTVNLPSGKITERDGKILEKFFSSKPAHMKFHLVCHSRGGMVAERFLLNHPQVDKVVILGCPIATTQQNIYEIIGRDEVLVEEESQLPLEKQRTIPCGHLGLLTHPKSHKAIVAFLMSD